MAWLELHDSLPQHPKLHRLAGVLGVSRHEAIGLVVDLWVWALAYADDGKISRYSNAEICSAIGYRPVKPIGGHTDLIGALIEAGLVDRRGRGLRIHDWDHYVGRLLHKRAANRQRAKRWREDQRDGEGDGKPERTRTQRIPNAQRIGLPTNQTKPTNQPARARAGDAQRAGDLIGEPARPAEPRAYLRVEDIDAQLDLVELALKTAEGDLRAYWTNQRDGLAARRRELEGGSDG